MGKRVIEISVYTKDMERTIQFAYSGVKPVVHDFLNGLTLPFQKLVFPLKR